MINLTQQDLKELKERGFSDQEISEAIKELEEDDLSESAGTIGSNRDVDPRRFAQHSGFSARPQEDLIKWQLELNDILERAEHILKGDIVKFENGKLIWAKNPNPKLNCLNDEGVHLIMKILSNYINRNTILSDYPEDEIREKVFDFGRELNNLVFMMYEEMGMDTESKRKEYPMLIRQMVDIVHSSYARAKDGGERRSLREMISVSQSHSSMAQGGITVNTQGQPQRTRGILNPMRYISGKYV